MMNTEQRQHAAAIAEAIRAKPEAYDQGKWGDEDLSMTKQLLPSCMTPACIAGWSLYLKRQWEELYSRQTEPTARQNLGLDATEANALFSRCWAFEKGLLRSPTAAEAAAVMERLARGDMKVLAEICYSPPRRRKLEERYGR